MLTLGAPFRVRKDAPTATDTHVDSPNGIVVPFKGGPLPRKRKKRNFFDVVKDKRGRPIDPKETPDVPHDKFDSYGRWITSKDATDAYGNKVIGVNKHMSILTLRDMWDKKYPEPFGNLVTDKKMKESVKKRDIEAVVVGYDTKRHRAVLVDGHHRVQTAFEVGIATLPAVLIEKKVKKKRGYNANDFDLPIADFSKAAHDVSNEPRDADGKWTARAGAVGSAPKLPSSVLTDKPHAPIEIEDRKPMKRIAEGDQIILGPGDLSIGSGDVMPKYVAGSETADYNVGYRFTVDTVEPSDDNPDLVMLHMTPMDDSGDPDHPVSDEFVSAPFNPSKQIRVLNPGSVTANSVQVGDRSTDGLVVDKVETKHDEAFDRDMVHIHLKHPTDPDPSLQMSETYRPHEPIPWMEKPLTDPDDVDALHNAKKVTQSVHETGGRTYDGVEVKPNVNDAEVATKILINRRIVEQLRKEMDTDPKLAKWADDYAAEKGYDDVQERSYAWSIATGHHPTFDDDKYNAAVHAFADAKNAWLEQYDIEDPDSLAPKSGPWGYADQEKLYNAAVILQAGKTHGKLTASYWNPDGTPRSKGFDIDHGLLLGNVVARLGGYTLEGGDSSDYMLSLGRGMDILKKYSPKEGSPTTPKRDDFFRNDTPDARTVALAVKIRNSIDTWAGSSGDHRVVSVALQRAVADYFGIKPEFQQPLKAFATDNQSHGDTGETEAKKYRPTQSEIEANQSTKMPEELKVGDVIFGDETISKIFPFSGIDEGSFNVETTRPDGLIGGDYFLPKGRPVEAGPQPEPIDTVWAIAGKMLNAERPFYNHFVRAVYDATQEDLKKAGAKSLLLYRGMHLDKVQPGWAMPKVATYERLNLGGGKEKIRTSFKDTPPTARDVVMQPISSWSSSYETAQGFSSYGSGNSLMLKAVVPATRVFSLASGTGPGCLNEREVVVIGGPAQAEVSWPNIPDEKSVTPEEFAQYDSSEAVIDSGDHPYNAVGKVVKAYAPLYIDAPLVNADWIKFRTNDIDPDGNPIIPSVRRYGNDHIALLPNPLRKAAHDVSQEARDQQGEWTAGGGAPSVIHASEQPGHGRKVTTDEFTKIAMRGQKKLDAMAKQSSPHVLGPDKVGQHWSRYRIDTSYTEAQKSWGGMTIDAHTGNPITTGAKKWAVTTKPPGMKTISIPENATKQQYAAAYKHALKQFASELNKKGAALGIFHDDDKHTIDFDPSTVVSSLADAEAIGAASHAIGGAYCFADGNGYWPPYVEEPAEKPAPKQDAVPMIPLNKPTSAATPTPPIHRGVS